MMDSFRTQKLMTSYNRMGRAVRMRLLDRYHAKLIWGVIAETRQELATLIPKIPYIGEKNIWQSNLDTCTMNLALYRTLMRQGFELREAVKILYDISEAFLQSFPMPLRWAYRWYTFSPFYRRYLRLEAARSQKKQYPGDWVFTYIDGNDSAFDFGVDISECAIVKLYRAHGCEEFVPYLCKLDLAMGKIFGLGFSRSSTLAEGGAICNCRWKREADTPGWPPILVFPNTSH